MTDRESTWTWPRSRRDQRAYLATLRLTPEDMAANRSALGRIVHVVHQKTDLTNVDRVTTCGSVGKGTAFHNSWDLDLVVYLRDVSPGALGSCVRRYLDEIGAKLDAQYPGTRDESWYEKFSLRYHIAGMEIDILIGAVGVSPRDFLSVDDGLARSYMSASVSHRARDFIKKQSAFYKVLVQVVKDWRDSYDWAGKKPKSYLLEVLLLEAFRRHKRLWQKSRNKVLRLEIILELYGRYLPDINTKVLISFFEMIGSVEIAQRKNYNRETVDLLVWFDEYYGDDDIPWDRPDMLFQKRIRSADGQTFAAPAVVLDPANPTNNLWFTLGDADRSFTRRARETAKMLRDSQHA